MNQTHNLRKRSVSDNAAIADVSDTAFWVTHFRAVENARPNPMFQDPFAKTLAGDRGKAIAESMPKTSRYTEWSVLARTVVIDRFIMRAIEEGIDAIINLGAGLDTRPYRMNLPPTLQWIEADYPNIIEYKQQVLAAENPRCQLSRVAVDLADTDARNAFFNHAAADANRVLILTEGVIPYLSPDEVATLAGDLLAQERFCYWVTEYLHSSMYRYLQEAARGDAMKNAPFKFFPQEWYAFFAGQGWVEKETRYFGEIAREFKRKVPMPWFGRIIVPLLPAKVKKQILQSSGFVIFKRKSEQ